MRRGPFFIAAALAALPMLLGCKAAESEARADVSTRLAAVEHLEHGVVRAAALGKDVTAAFDAASSSFQAAEHSWIAAQASSKSAGEVWDEARVTYEQAQKRWEFYQVLVVVAAAVDANNLEKFRQTTGAKHVRSLDCADGMSTSSYRRQLMDQGVSLVGKDIDHIVPHSLGGAHHPANYQVLDASFNRSLGNEWSAAKCAKAEDCAGAVAISRRCGSFAGTGY